jgi:hypothetical protein
MLRRRQVQGHIGGDQETPCNGLYQGGIPPRVVGQPRVGEKEGRQMEDVCRLHRSQQSMPEGSVPFAAH